MSMFFDIWYNKLWHYSILNQINGHVNFESTECRPFYPRNQNFAEFVAIKFNFF